MAKRRRRQLGYYDLRRFVVVGRSGKTKRVYSNVVDALAVARRCSDNKAGKPCKVLHGLPGAEAVIATCQVRKCRTPGGAAISMRKLYEAEQRGAGAMVMDEVVQSRKKRGAHAAVKAPAVGARKRGRPKKVRSWGVQK